MALKSLFFGLAFVWTALAHGQGLHVIFDLDGTLIESISERPAAPEKGTEIIEWNGQLFRLADFAPEVIAKLRDAGYKISFFSAGTEARNHVVVERIRRLILERTGSEFVPNKILGPQDLTRVFGVADSARTREKFRKDVQRVAFPGDVILVDDIKEFAMPDQERNMLLIDGEFKTVRQVQKLLVVMEILLGAREFMKRAPVQYLQAVRGLAHGAQPGPSFNDEVFTDLMRKALNRFGLPLRLNERSYPWLQIPHSCNGIYF